MSKGEQPPSPRSVPSKVICDALGPLGGTFVLGISLMPPLPKTCPKTISAPQKGVAFLTEDVFEKKEFSGAGEGSAVGASASTYGSAATGRGSARADGIGHSARFRLAASRPVTSQPRRFRTIQVCPRDLPARRW
jgi:hypothetical protein